MALLLLLLALLSARVPAQPPDSSLLPEPVVGYVCPMHPQYTSHDPGSCPICGMDLVALVAEGDSDTGAIAPGTAVVSVAPEMVQSMGVRTASVVRRRLGRQVRAFGTVEPNTRLETVVASRVEGWLEELAVTAEGDRVQAGELLYRVYSPDLIAAQQDYLAALRGGATARTQSAARRLRSLGMQIDVITRLGTQRELIERVPVYAESAGVVSALAVREGAYVKPGDDILHLQSYAEVWVIAAVAEQDLPGIAPGLAASLTFPSVPGSSGSGRVDYVYPTVDPRTRTGRVRILVDNAAGRLKPGAYADVDFVLDAREQLVVPSQALLRDSRGSHVVVALGNGRFEGRAIEPGLSAGGMTAVLSGLAAGEQVVVSGQFLLDSEASLREGFAKMAPVHQHDAMEDTADPQMKHPMPDRRPDHEH
jgi:Cu(I)/Ag(I) efflux system membrane fusion protein